MQEFDFDLSYDLQAEKLQPQAQTTAQHAQPAAQQLQPPSLLQHRQLPACPDSPHLAHSPSHGAQDSINALGLDSPDSYLDGLHTRSIQQHALHPTARLAARSVQQPAPDPVTGAASTSVQHQAQPAAQSLQGIQSRCAKLIQQLDEAVLEPCQPMTYAQAVHLTESEANEGRPAQSAATAALLASAAALAQQLPRQLLSKPPMPQHTTRADVSRFAPSQARPALSGPAQQAGQQLQEHLMQYQGLMMGGYAVSGAASALQVAPAPYQRMLSLKTVLAQRLQANKPTDPASLLEEAGWQPYLQQSKKARLSHDATDMLPRRHLGTDSSSQAEEDSNLRANGPYVAAASLPTQTGAQQQAAFQGDGTVQMLTDRGHQLPYHHHPAGGSRVQHTGLRDPLMLAVQTSVPVASTMPLQRPSLSCSELLPQSPMSLKQNVHPFFQVPDPALGSL